MNHSPFGNVLYTTRLIKHFNDDNIARFKQFVFDQLNCENESEFYCKILPLIHKSLGDESLEILKKQAIKIAEQQPFDNDPRITVYKAMNRQNNDNKLVHLHSDIIDLIGSFSNKHDSIVFGRVCKQLYIETQKKSYVLKRCKDKRLLLNEKKLNGLLWAESNVFNYSSPTELEIIVPKQWNNKTARDYIDDRYLKIFSKRFFINMFARLDKIKINSLHYLGYIPVDLLFGLEKNVRNKHGINSDGSIESLSIFGFLSTDDKILENEIEKFCNNLTQLCLNNNNVKQLVRPLNKCNLWISNLRSSGFWLTKLVLTLSQFCRCKRLFFKSGKIILNTNEDIRTMFHSDLKQLRFNYNTSITFSKSSILEMRKDPDKNIDCKLSIISYCSGDIRGAPSVGVAGFVNVLNDLKDLGLLKSVQCFEIGWMQNWINFGDWDLCYESFRNRMDPCLNEVFVLDRERYPLLRKIRLIIKEATVLSGCAMLFLYLIEKKNDKIWDKDLDNNNKIKIIEIEFDTTSVNGDYLIQPENSSTHELFNYQRNDNDKEYAVDDKIIEWNDCHFTIKSFGIMYQNLIHWFKQCRKNNIPTIKGRMLRIHV